MNEIKYATNDQWTKSFLQWLKTPAKTEQERNKWATALIVNKFMATTVKVISWQYAYKFEKLVNPKYFPLTLK
jgi:hypothetical protein